MDNNYIKNNIGGIFKKFRNLRLVVVICILLTIILGATFAYFAASVSSNNITGDAASVDLSLTVTKVLPTTEGVDDIIIVNFTELATSLNSDCVYDEDYSLCQLYKVNLANNSVGLNTRVKGSISFDNTTTPNLSWIKIDNYNSSTTYTSAMIGNSFNTASSTFTSFVDDYLLNSGDNIDFYILVWINEIDEIQYDEGTYSGTIKFEDSNGKGISSAFNE